MATEAKRLGYAPEIKTENLAGDAMVIGRDIMKEISAARAGTVLLYGGETIVHVTQNSEGGRNQELSLAALIDITDGVLISSVASDGIDNGPHAAGIADAITKEHALKIGLSPKDFSLRQHSFEFFSKTGDFLETGSTGSNVSDLIIALKRQ
jgi:hydroxypyruvate reductase